MPLIHDYNRIYIYNNQNSLKIPVLLERKQFILNDKKQFFNPIIIVNNKQQIISITWTPELDKILNDSVIKYRSDKGKKLIPWTKIKNEVKSFNLNSPGALRVRWECNNK